MRQIRKQPAIVSAMAARRALHTLHSKERRDVLRRTADTANWTGCWELGVCTDAEEMRLFVQRKVCEYNIKNVGNWVRCSTGAETCSDMFSCRDNVI